MIKDFEDEFFDEDYLDELLMSVLDSEPICEVDPMGEIIYAFIKHINNNYKVILEDISNMYTSDFNAMLSDDRQIRLYEEVSDLIPPVLESSSQIESVIELLDWLSNTIKDETHDYTESLMLSATLCSKPELSLIYNANQTGLMAQLTYSLLYTALMIKFMQNQIKTRLKKELMEND